VLEALFEAMSHDNVLAGDELREEVQAALTALAAGDADACAQQLQAAAERLQSAREVVYPVTIHLVDLGLLDEAAPEKGWPGAFDQGQPCTLIACASLLERLGKDHPDRLAGLRERVEADTAEVCGGPYVEREDPLLPLESQLWNLLKGQEVYERLL